MTFPNKI